MIVLDTHVWVWFVSNPERLSEKAAQAIHGAMEKRAIYISSISAWEVALLVAKKRLKLKMDVIDWISNCEKLPFFRFLPVDNGIVVRSVTLPKPLHKDPADRLIIATAITLGAPVVTQDEKLLNYPHAKTVW